MKQQATRRLGLLIFGIAFVVLFAIVAIGEGIGDPSVPEGDIALVQGAPGDKGEISRERFDHSLELTAIQAGQQKAPKPGDRQYDELKESTLNSILEVVWLQGLGAEMGVEVSQKEVDEKLEEVKGERFKSEAEFQKFLGESGFNMSDVYERLELQILQEAITEQLKEEAPKPDQSELENYYEAAKASMFTTKYTREFRMVSNRDRKKADAAFKALSKDNSEKNWAKVAGKYSSNPASRGNGGLQPATVEGGIEEPLNEAIFGAPKGQVEGPVNAPRGYTVFEVVDSTPESVQAFKAVEGQIESTMTMELEQEYIANVSRSFLAEWAARTFCASGYVTERCANYQGGGHPSAAPAGCYEADPKGGRPEACPAPVFQLVPALPGSVNPLEPRGRQLAQRPVLTETK